MGKCKRPKAELQAKAREMIEILAPLNMDIETLQAAILFVFFEVGIVDEAKLTEDFGPELATLVNSVKTMDAIGALKVGNDSRSSEPQIDNIRKMLLAMVEDVRAW